MATYKVIQDIEAEDKLLGPLTFRQFIYAGTCAGLLYLTFLVSTKGAPFMAVVFLPPALLSGFFAWPWSRDQPTEVWALAKIRFLIKPRKRIWNQSGTKELVTITAPKKIAAIYTNGLSETEVRSRLKALADTIDSRGWAIKNVNVNMYSGQQDEPIDSDRLINMASLPQAVPDNDIRAEDDMLEENNTVARQFDDMIAASTKAHRQEILDHLQGTHPEPPQRPGQEAQQNPANYWFLNNQPGGTAAVPNDAVTFNTQIVTPGAGREELPVASGNPTADEQALVDKIRQQEQKEVVNPYNHWHTIQPISAQGVPQAPATALTAQPGQMPPMQQMPVAYPSNDQPQTYQQAYDTAGQAQAQPYQPPAYTPQMPQQPGAQTQNQQVTQTPDPAILELANNNDLNVSTLAREANKHKQELENEVVISLH
jgi:hypothetical protein